MNKKSLKKMVKNYFVDNNRMLSIFVFIFVLMFLIFVLMNGGSSIFTVLYLAISFVVMLVLIYWKVWYVTFLAYRDIKKQRFLKTNVNFQNIKEDKSWLLWNSNPKNSSVCKYLASDSNGKDYRLCTACNYQNIKAIEKFVKEHSFRIVQLEKSKLIISIQANPAECKNKREAQEIGKTTKNLFGPFSYPFSYKEND